MTNCLITRLVGLKRSIGENLRKVYASLRFKLAKVEWWSGGVVAGREGGGFVEGMMEGEVDEFEEK